MKEIEEEDDDDVMFNLRLSNYFKDIPITVLVLFKLAVNQYHTSI